MRSEHEPQDSLSSRGALALGALEPLAGQYYQFHVIGNHSLAPRAMNNAGIAVGGAQESGTAVGRLLRGQKEALGAEH